jgi:hypothetical protein
MEKRRPNRSLRNSDEVMDALVDDYFRYDELAQMEAEAIRMNIRKEETSMYEYVEVDPLNLPNDLTSDLDERHSNDDDGAEKENVPNKRFRMVTDDDTDKFLEESVNRNTKSKTKSDMKIITDFLSSVGEKRNPDEIPAKELDSIMARFFLGVLKKDGSEYEPDSLGSMFNSIDRYLRALKSPLRYCLAYILTELTTINMYKQLFRCKSIYLNKFMCWLYRYVNYYALQGLGKITTCNYKKIL